MGWNFRKSKKVGPFRMTVSKSGVSASAGVKGFRVTKSTSGRTTKTVGIPGTGIYHTSSSTARQGIVPSRGAPPEASPAPAPRRNFTDFSKAERQELAAMATPEDRRAAWMAPRASLTLVQTAYRWKLNLRSMKLCGLAFALLVLLLVI